jgi:CRISPR-associated protein Csb2
MSCHLSLTVRFLDSRYHGLADGGEREWPPSPMRLFAALLAGAKTRWSDERSEAFLWLERQPPPVIRAPASRHGRELLTYVPNNNSDAGEIVRTAKVIRPTLLADPPLVEYVWTIDPADEVYAHEITAAARHLRALGWGIDMAIGHGAVVDQPSTVRPDFEVFAPRPAGVGGGTPLRVSVEGSLRSLEAAYAASLNRIRENGEIYDQPGPPTCDQRVYSVSNARSFCAFTLQTPDEETVTCRPQRIAELVGMIRHAASRKEVRAACDRLNQSRTHPDAIDVDRVILGHPRRAAGPRLSILPLPSIGHPHSDGQIRRVILAESAGTDGLLSRILHDVLHNTVLQPESPGEEITSGEVCLVRLNPNDRFLRFYNRSAHVWASVTPVLLPGYDDRKDHRGDHNKRLARAEQLVCKALSQSRIDVPACIELSRVPYWPGALHSREYQPRQKLAHYPRWHVRLKFDRSYTGPLAIGAGRHCGFGLFAACDD